MDEGANTKGFLNDVCEAQYITWLADVTCKTVVTDDLINVTYDDICLRDVMCFHQFYVHNVVQVLPRMNWTRQPSLAIFSICLGVSLLFNISYLPRYYLFVFYSIHKRPWIMSP